MRKALFFLIFPAVFVSFLPVLAAPLQSSGFCAGERLIYAQDVAGLTPGGDADTAFINNRNFNRLATVSQINDDYVIWPNTILVNVQAGDVLHYRALGNSGSLNFDVLDINRQMVRRAVYGPGGPAASLTINQGGFLRFNAGSRADEYNLLALCPLAGGGGGGQSANHLPVFAQVGPFAVTAGQILNFQIFASDPDGDQIFYSAGNLPSGANFNASTRTFSWLPGGSQLGTRTISFIASDNRGGSANLNVLITVNPASQPLPGNNPPVWTQISSQITAIGQTLQFTVSAFDADGDVLAYNIIQPPSAADFNAVTRLFTWSPSPSQTGSHTLQFRVTDGRTNVDMFVPVAVQPQYLQQFYNPSYNPIYNQTYQPIYQPGVYPSSPYNIYASGLIYGINQPPVWVQTPDQRVTLGQTVQFVVYAYDPNGDYLTFQAFGVPSGAVFNTTTRTFIWSPIAQNQIGTYQLTFRTSDGINSADMYVTLTVSPAGQPLVTIAPVIPVYVQPTTPPAPAVPAPAPAPKPAPIYKLAPPAPNQSLKAFFAAIWALLSSLWFWIIVAVILLILLIRVYRKNREVVVI